MLAPSWVSVRALTLALGSPLPKGLQAGAGLGPEQLVQTSAPKSVPM